MCARTRAPTGRGAVREMAFRDWPVGWKGYHTQRARVQRRWALRLRPHKGEAVQERPEGQAVTHSARELPLVRNAIRTRVVRLAAECRPASRAAHRLHELRMRLHTRQAPPACRRRRTDL